MRFRRARRSTEESTAAGIYGLIVSGAVMAASHADSAFVVVVTALVTLFVYWAAERYSRLIAERIHTGHRPDWGQVRVQLTTAWEMVTVSALPLTSLILLSLLGRDLSTAVGWSLGLSTLLLCLAGWEVGRNGKLTGRERLMSGLAAGGFGVVLILLKAALH
jgi:hypothetical protein